FAHQLDMLNRAVDGTPPLNSRHQAERWHRVMTAEFNRLICDSRHGRPTLIDAYGTTNEAEFFAVTTECFFDAPLELREQHGELYALLQEYYGQDPAVWQTRAQHPSRTASSSRDRWSRSAANPRPPAKTHGPGPPL